MAKAKKTYYYKIDSKKLRKFGGFIVEASVYIAKAGKIVKIGDIKWDTSSYKGDESTVYEFLKNEKLISNKEYAENNGYYYITKATITITRL